MVGIFSTIVQILQVSAGLAFGLQGFRRPGSIDIRGSGLRLEFRISGSKSPYGPLGFRL